MRRLALSAGADAETEQTSPEGGAATGTKIGHFREGPQSKIFIFERRRSRGMLLQQFPAWSKQVAAFSEPVNDEGELCTKAHSSW